MGLIWLAILWILGSGTIGLQFYVLYRLFQRFSWTAIAFAAIAPILVFLITAGQTPLDRALMVVFSPWVLLWGLTQAMLLHLWFVIVTALALIALAVWVLPAQKWLLPVWAIIVAELLSFLPFDVQDLWSHPRALAAAEGMEHVSMRPLRDAVRIRLGENSNWLEHNNGQGKKDGELYLWSYQLKNWYLYDPDWWQ